MYRKCVAFAALAVLNGVIQADVTKTGDVTHTPDGVLHIGTGTYSVTGGVTVTELAISAATGSDSISSVLVDGIGTQLILNGAGSVNRLEMNWGTAEFTISGGASVDAATHPSTCTAGWCNTFIGNAAGSNATLTITGANSRLSTINQFVVGGTSLYTSASDGFDFGTPNATSNALIEVLDGGTLNTESGLVGVAPAGPSSPSDGEHALATVNVDGTDSNWNINGDAIGWSVLRVGLGNNATSNLNITRSAAVNVESTAADAGSSVSIGRAGGTGTALIDNSSMMISSVSRDAYLAVGRGTGSTGSLSLVNGGSLTLNGGLGAYLQIGRGGATGSMEVKDATLEVVESGARNDDVAAHIDVARNSGGSGTLLVENSNVTVSSENNHAIFRVGRRNAGTSGTATIDNSTLAISSVNWDAVMQIGREDGASGIMNIQGGSTVSVTSSSTLALAQVGRQDTDTSGVLNVTGTGTTLTVEGPESVFQVGRASGSTGVMNVTDRANVSIGGGKAALLVGQEAGSIGSVQITGGATVDVSGSVDSDVTVGNAFINPDISRPNAGTGSLTVSGIDSKLSVGDGVWFGAQLSHGGVSGTGTVSVKDGGEIAAARVTAGQGGLLNGNGTVTANVFGDGGTIAPGNSPGSSPDTLTIDGNLTLDNGLLMLDTISGVSDLLDVSGDVTIGANAAFKLLFDELPVSGGKNLDDYFDASKPVFDNGFLGTAISVLTGNPSQAGDILLVTYGANSIDVAAQVVPVPAALPLFFSALGVMGVIARRKRARLVV